MDGMLVGPARDRGARADDAYSPVVRGTKGCCRSGRDDTLNGNFEKLFHSR